MRSDPRLVWTYSGHAYPSVIHTCERLVRVGKIGLSLGVELFTADFNCTVTDPSYVNEILDRVRVEHPELWGRLSYVEQPFPYELEEHPIPVQSVAQRVPLFLDESAHDWRMVRLGRELGWTVKFPDIKSIVATAWKWHQAHPAGFGDR